MLCHTTTTRFIAPIIGLLLIGLSTVSAQTFRDCDATTYVGCQSDLNQKLSIQDNQPWFNTEYYRSEIEKYYQTQGPNGMRKVCRAIREFKQCMGGNYTMCVNAAFYVSVSATTLQAYQLTSLFNQMHFVCGAGMQIYLSNEGCMSNTWKPNVGGDQLNACRYQWERRSDVNPEDAAYQACTEANNLLTCFENQFSNNCGIQARDTQFWACEYARVNVFTRFPQCNIKCVLPYQGGIG